MLIRWNSSWPPLVGERQVAELVQDDDVEPAEVGASVPAVPRWVADEAFEQKLDSRPGRFDLAVAYS